VWYIIIHSVHYGIQYWSQKLFLLFSRCFIKFIQCFLFPQPQLCSQLPVVMVCGLLLWIWVFKFLNALSHSICFSLFHLFHLAFCLPVSFMSLHVGKCDFWKLCVNCITTVLTFRFTTYMNIKATSCFIYLFIYLFLVLLRHEIRASNLQSRYSIAEPHFQSTCFTFRWELAIFQTNFFYFAFLICNF
jgi:hypothetical protein